MARIDTASQVEALSPNPKLHMLDVTVLTAASCGRPIVRHAVLRLLLKGQDMVCETSNDSLSGPLGPRAAAIVNELSRTQGVGVGAPRPLPFPNRAPRT